MCGRRPTLAIRARPSRRRGLLVGPLEDAVQRGRHAALLVLAARLGRVVGRDRGGVRERAGHRAGPHRLEHRDRPTTLTRAPSGGSARTNGTCSAARWITCVTPRSSHRAAQLLQVGDVARDAVEPASSSSSSSSRSRWSLPPRSYVVTPQPSSSSSRTAQEPMQPYAPVTRKCCPRSSIQRSRAPAQRCVGHQRGQVGADEAERDRGAARRAGVVREVEARRRRRRSRRRRSRTASARGGASAGARRRPARPGRRRRAGCRAPGRRRRRPRPRAASRPARPGAGRCRSRAPTERSKPTASRRSCSSQSSASTGSGDQRRDEQIAPRDRQHVAEQQLLDARRRGRREREQRAEPEERT